MDLNAQSQVELRLQARHLPNKDLMSKTDAFAVVYLQSGPPGGPTEELGRTEVVRDNLHPEWAAQIVVTYIFEVQQTLIVKIYDEDRKGSGDLSHHDFIGQATISVGSLMCSAGQQKTLPVTTQRSGGVAPTLTIRGEELAACNDFLHVTFSGKKLANKDGMFGKSDPYISLKKCREDGTFVEVWKSDVVMDNLNPTWKPVKLAVGNLCNGDYDRPLRLEVFDWDKDGNHDPMGGAQTTLRTLVTGEPIELIEDKKKGKSGYKNSGHVVPFKASVTREPSLSDYIKGGCRVNLLVGIDFTGSNGSPEYPNSLHFLDRSGQRLNQYQQAILGIGSILKDYSTDGSFNCFGFGATLPNKQVSHCFPLTFADPRVMGVEGLMGAYMNCLPQVKLSGPTLFAPILNTVVGMSTAPQSQSQQYYNVLLMITDGEINDMEATIASVVSASSLPLSVIIVGVGEADFTNMNALDGDGGLLRSSTLGKSAVRDCVQFVPFRDFAGKHFSELAKATLAEVPAQLLAYFRLHNLVPNPPLPPRPADAATPI